MRNQYRLLYRNDGLKSNNKYRNKKVIYDGFQFDSQKECERYKQLKLLERAGCIKELELQKVFELQPAFSLNKKKIQSIKYICDFYYYDNNKQKYIVEDVKSVATKTQVYLLKKKMMQYKYKIEINEV